MKKILKIVLITFILITIVDIHIIAKEDKSSDNPFDGVDIVTEENAIPITKNPIIEDSNGFMGQIKNSEASPRYSATYNSPYWKIENGSKYFYNGLGELVYDEDSKKVVDVSEHQGKIDWEKVKSSGVDGAIIRIGFGYNNLDKTALYNISECNRLGIPYGLYLYSYAYDANFAYYEALGLAEMLKQTEIHLSFPIYYDVECFTPWTEDINGNMVTHYAPDTTEAYEEIIGSFITEMNKHGYSDRVHVYSYRSMLNGVLNSSKILPYVSWAAEYGPKLNFSNDYYTGASGWQYTSSETISGIYGNADVSCFSDYFFDSAISGKWIRDGIGWWYRHSDGSYTKNDFEVINGNTYYFNERGYMQTGWQYIRDSWYYFEGSGAMLKNTWYGEYWLDETGVWQRNVYKQMWIKNDTGWWYRHSDGSYTTNDFEVINGNTYYFNGRGYMQTGWQDIHDNWYYFEGSGAMLKNTWHGEYWLDDTGVWQRNVYKQMWIKNDTGWWYRHSDGGYTKNDFEVINGNTYYFNGRGYMQTGWQDIHDNWYYFEGSGAMLKNTWYGEYWLDETGVWQRNVYKQMWIKNNTGWWYRHSDGSYTTNDFEVINGNTYYFNGRGYMQTGWQFINSKWYYFNGSGAMLKNTYVDGYWLDENGVWK